MTQDQNDSNKTEKKVAEEKVSNVDFLMKADQQTKNVKSTHINLSQDSAGRSEPSSSQSQSTPDPTPTTNNTNSDD